jgi:hypothetical protein
MSSWAAGAEIRIVHLEHEIARVSESGTSSPMRIEAASTTLAEAKHWLRPWPYLRGTLGGSGPERVWGRIHEVEEILEGLDGKSQELFNRARDHVRAELPRDLSKWERDYRDAPADQKDQIARYMIERSHEAAATKWATQRNQQRGIIWISLILLGMAVLAMVLQSLTTNRFLPAPQDDLDIDPGITLVIVMAFGALGGILSGLVALYLGQNQLENTRWLDLRPALILAKAAFGIWAAVVGAAAVGTELIVGNYQSLPALVLIALVFGYGQQAVTTFLDQRAASLLKPEAIK